jgi:NADPH-dependent ferric siderophore reductase
MLTSDRAVVEAGRPSYRPYRAEVTRLVRLTPHFTRVTFVGDDLDLFGTDGLDQRVKVVFPLDGHGISDFGANDPATIDSGDWYARWRALPDEKRNPFRTYTVRAVRQQSREVDIDMVAHGDSDAGVGPAARWLNGARLGDRVVLVGPDARSDDSAVGIDWRPGDATELLLVGDETAAPAICSVLESLPAGRTARAFIEIPDAADALPVRLPAGCTISWLARSDAPVGTAPVGTAPVGTVPVGELLDSAVRRWVVENPAVYAGSLAASAQTVADVDVDRELLWDSPARQDGATFYAWLAGEAAVIKRLRRLLVSETGIERTRIAFMGYWRLGKAEAQ